MKLGMAQFLSYEPAECTRSFGIICAPAISKSKKIKISFLGSSESTESHGHRDFLDVIELTKDFIIVTFLMAVVERTSRNAMCIVCVPDDG
jgi:hypothetical protein